MDTQTITAPEADEKASPEAMWLAEMCTHNHYFHPKLLDEKRYACVMPLLFTHAIIVGRIGDNNSYEDRWCYGSAEQAIAALDAWDGTGEPQGWHRHPMTGRRRDESGVEYIDP
jgi:hypothetical protein